MRMARAIVTWVALLALGGCASWQTAVIGQSPRYPLALWRGSDVRGVVEEQGGRLAPVTWTRVLGPGLDPTWALVDYHEASDGRAAADTVVVEGMHRVDATPRFPALGPLVEHALARHDIWVASHEEDTDEALAPFEGATLAPPRTEIVAMAWSTDRIALTVTTTIAATRFGMPCGGASQPEEEIVLGGIVWSRGYEVTADGTVTPTTDDVSSPLPGPPYCDPRLPLTRSGRDQRMGVDRVAGR